MEPLEPAGCFPLGVVLQGKPEGSWATQEQGFFYSGRTNTQAALLPHFISDNVHYPVTLGMRDPQAQLG